MTSTTVGANHLMDAYPPHQVTFVEGHGSELWDARGRRYLDFLSGLAVTSLGHSHPEIVKAIADQASKLTHVSNLFGNVHGPRLAGLLDHLLGGGGKIFFSNSGAEANEAALKLARKWGGPGRFVVLTASQSFHGRTLATLHATGQPAKHEPFQPLPQGFRHVEWNDLEGLEQAITPDVAAVLLEPIQGEGGVRTASASYLEGVEEICAAKKILFMVDEIQTGLARTGHWFAFQEFGVNPDVVTVAKALGNGFPIGATWAKAEIASAFGPGDHGSTFGGQPLAAATAARVIEVMMEIDAPSLAVSAGRRLSAGLHSLDGVAEVRGRGLLLAAELMGHDAKKVASRALIAGLVVNAVTPTALRLAPPLIVRHEEIDEAIETLRGVMT
ncbi:MAG: acetylornithine/succinylornithine family transaminase [Acidimicrobiia bacterium]|nr:acetylornithine/succinylornithine family transaminase [Acidimicrobiia bacterium]